MRRLSETICTALLAFGVLTQMGLSQASAQDEAETAPCRISETGRALDFWVGEWTVTDGGDADTQRRRNRPPTDRSLRGRGRILAHDI